MIGCFPDPYPDELLYSVCARFCDRLHINSEAANLELFGVRYSSTVIDLPHRLSYLVARLSPNKIYTEDSLIDEHSNFPFYSPFLPAELVKLIREAMKSPSGSTVHNRTGVSYGRVKSLDRLRFCPSCVYDDRKQFGECYWHRLHQLPGILMCTKHAVYLEDSSERVQKPLNRWSYISAEQVVWSTLPKPVDLGDTYQIGILKIAIDAAWLLKQRNLVSGVEDLQNRYLIMLTERGLAHERKWVRVRKLVNVIREQYPLPLLRLLHCDFDEQKVSNWPVNFVSYIKQKRTQHPLRHLVIIHSLGFTAETFFQICTKSTIPKIRSMSKPFGNGPWPCLNPTCNHYHELCIETCSISKSWDKKGPLVGTFICTCGFQYTRRNSNKITKTVTQYDWVKSHGKVWEEALITLWKDTSITVSEIARRLGIAFDAIKNHAVRLGLEFPRPGPHIKPVRANPEILRRKDEAAKKLELCRKEWLNVIKYNPKASRTTLQSHYPFRRLYRWLKSNDPAWLSHHLPIAYVMSGSFKGIGWGDMDSLLSKKVRLSAIKLRKVKERPSRITVAAIGRDTGQFTLLTHKRSYRERLPLTFKVLEDVVETHLDYCIRRVQWAANIFQQNNELPTRKMLALRTGLTWESLRISEVKTAISLAWQGLQHSKQTNILAAA